MHIASPTPTSFHSTVASAIRAIGTGFEQGANQTGIAADKGAIYPFEAISSLTGILKEATAKVPVVSKGTSLVHTIGGFALLIAGSQVSGTLKAPGGVAKELLFQLADAIDGQKQANGFVPPWFAQTIAADGTPTIAASGMFGAMQAAAER